jgi:hypothetical protein
LFFLYIKGKVILGKMPEQQIVGDCVNHLNAYRCPIAAEGSADYESGHQQATQRYEWQNDKEDVDKTLWQRSAVWAR